MNKHGWLKIIESFIAIILVMGIVLVVANNENTRREDTSSGFYNIERGILKQIQLNSSLRSEILATNGIVEWEFFPTQAHMTKSKIEAETPNYINCIAKICSPSDLCVLADEKITGLGIKEKDIYAESLMITSNLTSYSPRVLKLFCWGK